ncbi:MAG TPA: hypothetical protein VK878_13670 [Candidatus Deferrimicrobiaceae bacterium]|nr:hypothetical protein [Candidatus Deferrimicrobiaceae bacterium]
MRVITSMAAGLAVFVLLSTGTALGQGKPGCDAQGKAKTAEQVAGQVVRLEPASNKVSVRESNGTVYEFQASQETLQGLKVGDHIEARLREAPKCP